MPGLAFIPAAVITGSLDPAGRHPNADRGDPQVANLSAVPNAQIGVWECQPGGWSVIARPDTEVCYLLSGTAVITDAATGERQRVHAGDLLVLPAGWSGRWDVSQALRTIHANF